MTRHNLTRRSAIGRAAAGTLAIILRKTAFAASDFWNQKPPSDWNSDEINRLMNKSPWAKEVSVGLSSPAGPNGGAPDSGLGGIGGMGGGPGGGGGGGYGGMGGGGGGYGGMGGGGMGGMGGGGGGRRGGMGGGGARPNQAVTVRWDSAQPMLDATKETMPKDFDGHYVIAVAGLPMGWGMGRGRGAAATQGDQAVRVSDIVERLKAGATLEAKGKDPEGAGVVKRAASDESWLFGFSRELLPLGPGDKDIEFTLKTGPMVIRAKFNPKDMMYKGQFAA